MWDPLFTGESWLEHLLEARSNLPTQFLEVLTSESNQFSGHLTGPGFVDAVRARKLTRAPAGRVSAVLSKNYRHREMLETVTEDILDVDNDCTWQANTSSVLYPVDAIKAICNSLS